MRYLILGGTGTLGEELTRQIIQDKSALITCFSRDECKQQKMKKRLLNPHVRFVIGDIRDGNRLKKVMEDHDIVFHVAALKHVDVGEENPEESVKTNLLGTIEAADAAQEAGIRNFIFSSTDKAVDPINVYGMTKGISERILLSRNRSMGTRFSVYRWGNVVGSRGSVITDFKKSLLDSGTVNLTSPAMTRFWIKIEDVVKFMLTTYENASRTDVMVPDIKAAKVTEVISVIAELLGLNNYTEKVVGLRPGEKLHECLRSIHGNDYMASAISAQLTRTDLKRLLSPIVLGV